MLHNELLQNWAAESNIHLLSSNFCESGIREQLSWAVLAQDFSWGCTQEKGQTGRSHLHTQLGQEDLQYSQDDSHGCWQEASVSHCVNLSIGCLSVLITSQLAFLRVRDHEREPGRKYNAFYGLISKVSCCHPCHSLFIRSKLLYLASLKKRRIKLHFLKGGVSKNLRTCFKTTTGRACSQVLQVLVLGQYFQVEGIKKDFIVMLLNFWYYSLPPE